MPVEQFYEWMTVKGCGMPLQSQGLLDETLEHLTTEVFPYVDSLIQNETENAVKLTKKQSRTAIIGYSLGGLASCYGAWTRPEVMLQIVFLHLL